MSKLLPSPDDLRKLPPRALMAFAARCCRRIQPLYELPHGQPHPTSLEEPLRAAEAFAKMSGPVTADAAARLAAALQHAANAAHYAAHAWSCVEPWEHRQRDDPAANAAASYAEEEAKGYRQRACDEAREAVKPVADDASADVAAVAAQIARTATHVAATHVVAKTRSAVALDFVHLRELPGTLEACDPSDSGPLGPLWPAGEPSWAGVRA
jgi:hypothetical protein